MTLCRAFTGDGYTVRPATVRPARACQLNIYGFCDTDHVTRVPDRDVTGTSCSRDPVHTRGSIPAGANA
jgi:hypothetical protein